MAEQVTLPKRIYNRDGPENTDVTEIPLQEGSNESGSFCDVCKEQFVLKSASHLCFLCELYLCGKCFVGHDDHFHLKVTDNESERKSKYVKLIQKINSDMDMVSEFEEEHISLVNKINVKQTIDVNDCDISGLCGLRNKRLAMCDSGNNCLKIFDLGPEIIKRYIRLHSSPWDITEVSPNPDITSVQERTVSVRDSIVAVTMPKLSKILLIDLGVRPAKQLKTIETDRDYFSLEFCDEKFYTLGDANPKGGRFLWSVFVLDKEGRQLRHFETDVCSIYSYFTITPGKIYLTDRQDDKIMCLTKEGAVLSEITIKGAWPAGITTDSEGHLYICTSEHQKVYRLSHDLKETKVLVEDVAGSMTSPDALCYFRNKLYITHLYKKNLVTVIGLF